jgi:hypothetical protein
MSITRRRFISTTRDALHKKENLDYSKGYNSYLANDVVPEDQLVYATDTRISTLGRQITRKGCDFYTVPAGETQDQAQTSATGAADKSLGLTTWLAFKFTAGATGRLTKLDLELKNTSATGPIIVELRADSSGSPGSVLGQSSIPASSPTGAYAYLSARFIEAPQVTSGTVYWGVAYIQDDGSGSYLWNSTTSATTAKTSSDSGSSWSSTTYDLHFKTYVSTDSPTLGQYRAYKSDGTKKSLLAHGTDLYTANDLTGAITSIKSGLSVATYYEFAIANDTVYYVNGQDAPRKWDFTTEDASGGSPEVAKLVVLHKNKLFYVSTSDPTKIFFSNAGVFETFTSTDFLYVPSPKSPDPIVRLVVFNDNLYIFTQKTKWVLFGSDIRDMVLRKALGTKGTKSPKTIQVTRNHIYFASDDGLYRFNGSTDELISRDITGDYQAATNQDDWGSGLFNNRYYVFYTPSGQAQNSRCWVYNINYNSMESVDTGAYISGGMTWDGPGDSGQFIQASSLVGALYYGEASSNAYTNLGKKLTWEIRTRYEHYGNPAAEKQIKRWYPRFSASSTAHSVLAQYDTDFRNTPTSLPIPLQGTGTLWGSGALWGAFTWGATALIPERLTIPGTANYTQLRYKRVGVNTPCEFLGHTTYYFTRRPR